MTEKLSKKKFFIFFPIFSFCVQKNWEFCAFKKTRRQKLRLLGYQTILLKSSQKKKNFRPKWQEIVKKIEKNSWNPTSPNFTNDQVCMLKNTNLKKTKKRRKNYQKWCFEKWWIISRKRLLKNTKKWNNVKFLSL